MSYYTNDIDMYCNVAFINKNKYLSNNKNVFYRHVGFKPLDVIIIQIRNLVSYMYVTQDVLLSDLLS